MRMRMVAVVVMAASTGWQCTRSDPTASAPVTPAERLEAMLAVQAHGDPRFAAIAARLPDLATAVDVLRRDTSAGGRSRQRRALASLLAAAWVAEPNDDLIRRLGVRDLAAVKQVIAAHHTPEVVALFEHDRGWREFAILRVLTDDPAAVARLAAAPVGWFASLAHATEVPGNACWRQEAPPSVQYLDPALTITTHVSINGDVGTGGRTFAQVKQNIDPQRWDDCSAFWSPPPNGTYLAVIAQPTPSGCTLTTANIIPASPNPSASPGSPSYTGKLYERFHCTTTGCQAWFENLLDVSVIPHTVPYSGGTPLPSHLISYRLPNCANGEQSGFLAGAILDQPTRVILDEGWMEAWEQDGRTHLKTFKKVQFGGPLNTWIAANILGMTELSNTMGELACCEP